VIHRDLKPSNVFLKGKEYSVKLGDFGIAKKMSGQCINYSNVGTILYSSPEVVSNSQYN